MSNIYEIKRVVAYENGKDATMVELVDKSKDESYIEILVPFSDPIAETPILQDASVKAMNHPHTTDDIFCLIGEVKDKIESKIILSIYLNTAFAYGYDKFCKIASESGVYALNIKDMPYAERDEIKAYANEHGLVLINTIATDREYNLKAILSDSKDVIYMSPSMLEKYGEDDLDALLEDINNNYNLDVLKD